MSRTKNPRIGRELDLSKANQHKHSDIKVGKYLVQIGGEWFFGEFSRECRQYLHDIVASPAMQKVISEVHQFIQQKIGEELGTFKQGWDRRIESMTLGPELREAIKKQARKQMDEQVEAWLRVAVTEQQEKMKALAKTQTNIIMRELTDEIKKQVKEEVAALVAKIVMEKSAQ